MSCSCHTEEKFDRVHLIVMDDRWLIINQMANVISIFYERVENILLNADGMTKVSARLVLTSYQKRSWLHHLTLFQADSTGLLENFLSQDVNSIHNFESETKGQSIRGNIHRLLFQRKPRPFICKESDDPRLWGWKTFALINYLQTCNIINGETETTLSNYWGNFESPSRLNNKENLQKWFCFLTQCSSTQVIDFNGCYAWLWI